MKRVLKWSGGVVGALVVLLVAMTAAGYFYFAPRIDQYTPQIEQIASQRLGEPVAIGSISLGWHGFGIEVELHHVAVLDSDKQRDLFSVERVRVDLNPLSFIHWPELHPAYVGIRGPRLSVKQRGDGRLVIPGLAVPDRPMPTLNDIMNVLTHAGTIAIDGGVITFSSPSNDISGWQFRQLDAQLGGPAQSPRVALSVTLPEPLGQDLKARIDLSRSQHDDDWHWRGDARLDALALDGLSKLAPSLPIDPHNGAVNVHLSGTGQGGRPAALRGQLRPADSTGDTVTRITADLDWHAGVGGTLDLRGSNMDVTLPWLFRGPLALGHAEVPLTFKHENGGWHLASKQFKLANAHLTTHGRFSMLLPDDDSSPRLDVKAYANGIDLKYKSRYLPVGIMPPDVTDWVDRSVKSGRVPRVVVIFRGPADDFPFRHGTGLFKVDFDLRDAHIKFDPEWPAVHHLDAEVEFKNEGLTADVIDGTIENMAIAGSRARIADLEKGLLEIEGEAKGDSADALAFLSASPISEKFGGYISESETSGKLDVNVKLHLPLADMDRFRVDGVAHLNDVKLTFPAVKTGFEQLNGALEFSDAGLESSTDMTARFMGAPVTISVSRSTGAVNGALVDLDGRATSARLMEMLNIKDDTVANGEFDWHARLKLPSNFGTANAEPLDIKVQSDFKGLALHLPPPFDKSEEQAVPTSATIAILPDGLNIKAHYDDALRAKLHTKDTASGLALDAGAVHFGASPVTLPESGLSVTGHLKRVSLAQWRRLGSLIATEREAAAAPTRINVDLNVDRVDVLDQHFHDVTARMDSDKDGYRLRLTGPDIAGTISLPKAADNKHPYDVSLDHLHLDAAFPQKQAGTTKLSPAALPPIRFESRDLRVGKRRLGTLKFELLQAPDGVVVPRFSLNQPAFRFNMYGTWIVDDSGIQHTRLAAAARSDDVKAAFKALDLPAAITADHAKIDAELHWAGPPSADIVDTLGGAFTIHLQDGSIPEVSPGAGRLLALLSLNALPRRLLFNFADVFGEGLSYDSMGGTFTITGGNAYTNDFSLESTIADVKVVGRVGLAQQDYDEVVTIDTSISSTLPVAGAIAGGPVTGAALLLLTQIFKQPLKKATELKYHVTGPWDDPQMQTVSGSSSKNDS